MVKTIFMGSSLVLVMLLAWGVIRAKGVYDEFSTDADPYIRDFLAEQSPWSYERAQPHMTREAIQATGDRARGRMLFQQFNKLGTLVSVDDVSMSGCQTGSHTASGSFMYCDFSVSAVYEKGRANISVRLTKQDDETKIMALNVDSDVFMMP